jgi:glycosyltransferase involved in cell wall biosynthesis
MIKLNEAPNKIEFLFPDSALYPDYLPEVSIVVPALNEEITIREFVQWCWEGLKRSGIAGEIIIVDSSSDSTPMIALEEGAKVLRTPKNGLGQAYLDAIPFIRGQFIIMGDCDLTYDFRKIESFVKSFKAGNDFVMGSRFKGTIESGAMPALHRYFGTPLTTWILNRIYGSKYTDIHCGMRGLTKEALVEINLTSIGWEYASEMVLKATRLGLKIDEVPVTFYKDREGRFSHHLRAGFWSPWYAGWINLKVMLSFSPDSFLVKPGYFLMILGTTIFLLSISNTFYIGSLKFSLHSLLLGNTLAVLGYSMWQVGLISRVIHGYRGGIEKQLIKGNTYDYGMCLSFGLISLGLLMSGFYFYLAYEKIKPSNGYSTLAIAGLFFIMVGAQTFGFTLLLELLKRNKLQKK